CFGSFRRRRDLSLPSTLLRAPVAHGSDNWAEALSPCRERVFHVWRHLRVDFAPYNAIVLQLPQLLREHLLRDSAHRPKEFREPLRAREEMIEDHRLPAAAEHLQGGFCWTHKRGRLHLMSPYYPFSKYTTNRCVLPLARCCAV